MLKRELCIHCIHTVGGVGDNWRSDDDERNAVGKCCLPGMDQEVLGQPPEECPYYLEHVVLGQDETC